MFKKPAYSRTATCNSVLQFSYQSFLKAIEPAEGDQQTFVVSYCSLGYRSGILSSRVL